MKGNRNYLRQSCDNVEYLDLTPLLSDQPPIARGLPWRKQMTKIKSQTFNKPFSFSPNNQLFQFLTSPSP